MNQTIYHFDDFTEIEYRNLLRLAMKTWSMISYKDYQKPGRVCIWRHDVDFSIHRAYRMASIEAEEGVQATYFIHIHSKFYNTFEDEISERILKILEFGHFLGVHFDPQYYVGSLRGRLDAMTELANEQRMLEHYFNTTIHAFSFHIPEIGGWISIDHDTVGGLINSYGKFIKNNFSYCSDSNGYWRFRRLRNVLEEAADEKLHVLTHPEMWTPESMTPRARVKRCVDGRAAAQITWYDEILARSGRENVG
jgi:hypothetical protein